MPTSQEYEWQWIAQGATVGINIYGYAENQVGVYCATPIVVDSPTGGDAQPSVDITLTQGESSFFNGMYQRTAYVQNNAHFNPVGAFLNLLYDFV